MAGQRTARRSLALVSIIIIILAVFSGCIGVQTGDPDKNPNLTAPKKVAKSTTKGTAGNPDNDTAPPSPISYLLAERGSTWLNWTWENPEDGDYGYAIIFIDGKFKANINAPKNYYNMTGLASERSYRIGIRTADTFKNINPEWINGSSSTLPKSKDLIPPDKIWYLEVKTGRNWLNWTWENPSDKDFSYSNVWIDGSFVANVTKSRNYFNKTGLSPDTSHTISIRTVDTSRNVNMNSVDGIANTLP